MPLKKQILFFFTVIVLISTLHRVAAASFEKDTVITLPTADGAIKSKVKYTCSDSMRFDAENQKMYLYGKAQVEYEKLKLTADHIELNMKDNVVFAEGGKDSIGNDKDLPVFDQEGKSFKSKKMTYNFETKKGRIIEVITKEGEGYIHGETVKKDSTNMYYIRDGKYTTCDLEHPHFYIAAKKLKIIPDDKIIVGPAFLVIQDVPAPLGIPFGIFPNKRGQKSGILIPTYGESFNQGYFLRDGGYYFGINDYVDLALRGDVFSRGSWGAKVFSNYNKRYAFNGNLSVRYSNNYSSNPELPGATVSKDLFITWNHNQDPKAHPDSRFSANVNAGSSKYNQLNSTTTQYNTNFYLTNTFQSNVGWYKTFTGTPMNLSVNLRHSQNTLTKKIDLSLPEVTFSVNRITPFRSKTGTGTHWYEKIGFSYTANGRNDITGTDSTLFTRKTLQQMRNGINHSIPLSTTFNLFKYITINPSANATSRWYFSSIEKRWDAVNKKIVSDTVSGFKQGTDFGLNVSANTKIYGMFQFKGNHIKAIRHVLYPSIGYSFRPDFSENSWGYYKSVQSDTTGKTQTYTIFENGIFGGPGTGKVSSLNFSLNNNLELKYRPKNDTTGTDKKLSLLDALSISSAYNFAAKQYKWSSIGISARTRLFEKIDINANGIIDPYKIDALGVRKDSLQYNYNGQIGRFTSGSIALTMNLRNDPSQKKNKTSAKGTEQELDYINKHPEAYIDFSAPWSLYISYNINYSKPAFVEQIYQTLSFSGDVSITKKWKIAFTSGYDFINKKMSFTSVNIYRDLHCWDMSINWIPFGQLQSYSLDIKVKSAVLQDLKISRRREWYDFR